MATAKSKAPARRSADKAAPNSEPKAAPKADDRPASRHIPGQLLQLPPRPFAVPSHIAAHGSVALADLTPDDLEKIASSAHPETILRVGNLVDALQFAGEQAALFRSSVIAYVRASLALLPVKPMSHPALRAADIDPQARFAEACDLGANIEAVRELLELIDGAADTALGEILGRAAQAGAWVQRSRDIERGHQQQIAIKAEGC